MDWCKYIDPAKFEIMESAKLQYYFHFENLEIWRSPWIIYLQEVDGGIQECGQCTATQNALGIDSEILISNFNCRELNPHPAIKIK